MHKSTLKNAGHGASPTSKRFPRDYSTRVPGSILAMIGKKYGRFTVVAHDGRAGAGNRAVHYLKCQCECGTVTSVNVSTLRNGTPQSCGCYRLQRCRETVTMHGCARTGNTPRAYKAACAIADRCQNPKNSQYHNYGGRGIRVCLRWRTQIHFVQDMGEPADGQSVDRINNDGHYSCGHCAECLRE